MSIFFYMSQTLQQVDRHVKTTDTIIWLAASEFTVWAMRRVDEYAKFQRRLCCLRNPPANYGSLTCILTHCIQHVAHTPIVMDQNLKQMLEVLQFKGISDKFGCFFLHNIDLENGRLLEIGQVDTPGTLRQMGVVRLKQREKSPPPGLDPSEEAVSWPQLKIMLNQSGRGSIIRKWVWNPEWSYYSQAEKLFCDFTQQYWDSITQSAFQEIPATPATLEEAMNYWTLESVKRRINDRLFSIYLTPSLDTLLHFTPAKSKDQHFTRKRTSFFPESVEHQANSSWAPYFKSGYVKDYQTALAESADNGKSLKDALDGILSNLQVLPFNPGKPTNLKGLWTWKQEAIEIHLNSSYLELPDKRIRSNNGTGKETRQRGINKTRPRAEIEEKLLQKQHSIHPKQAKVMRKAVAKDENHVMQGRRPKNRSKNYRVPPNQKKAT